ncbi:calmodulin, striated muscle-like [Crassostrea virginica]|uniref:Sulfhydryl light chain n=1 Tax=Crassostrea virginica TaxID=6565 RepID=A0A2H4PXG3_CRAVI|nr:caltractin [Crassostrea virginica]|eukprot:CAMPEP_0203762478 /NCGR_PEP_ID=MMETSP0098-20131031/15363_1 /ASSEMBLY_ACC=CAM_ASM_000208 /TAXON_ID=96639 /ORGANISM=" , Strain NY0313808BC1" /LENGTH=138 /DNA_ID=CAMNT_0050656909 /DNA_START=69 /DNA_END=485 /DNA_ORIENTATION=+
MSKVDETRKMWSEKFDSFDTSGNGELTVNELKAALVGMGANLTDQEIVAIFSDIDGDGSKAISKDEFIREMTKKNRQDAFKEFFNANDTDGSGALTADEIRKFAEMDSESSVEEILKQCDANSDGKITLEEFLKGIDG